MKIKGTLFLGLFLGVALPVMAQDDLLNELNQDTKAKEKVAAAFKGVQVCTMQSTKMAAKGEWYFLVSHRFGDLSNGFDNFFGLDNALTKIGGLYGPTEWLTLGVARHTLGKTYELSGKYRLFSQEADGFPFTIVGYHTIDINSQLEKEEYPDLKASDRFSFSNQLLISRKFSENFSVQMTPIYIHKNLYELSEENANQALLALGGRYKFSKRCSFNLEYAYRFNTPDNDPYYNPLTFGVDVETGGHIFQLVVSNSQAMNDIRYFTSATGNFDKGIYFGFNLYRVF